MNRPSQICITALFLSGISWTSSSSAQDPVSLKLVADVAAAKPGTNFRVAVKADIAAGWHIYWSNPGETGLPTHVDWEIPEGWTRSPTQYPIPQRYVQKITETVSLVSHTFEGESYFIAEITMPETAKPGSEVSITATVKWQACKEICTPPMTTPLSISVQVAGEIATSSSADAISRAWNKGQGAAAKVTVSATITDMVMQIEGDLPQGSSQPHTDSWYLPSVPGLMAPQQQQTISISGNTLNISIPVSKGAVIPKPLSGFLLSPDGTAIWLTTRELNKVPPYSKPGTATAGGNDKPSPATVERRSAQEEIKLIRSWGLVATTSKEKRGKGLLIILFMALAGGMILNLMPCVFPVLGIKIMGFVKQAGDDSASIRRHGWAFTFGVILSLWLLVGVLFIVREYGGSAGWGFQLQEPGFIIFMVFLMFVFALNLSGLFEFGSSLVGVGSKLQAKEGLGGAFFSGVLAVLVATPCTGPFMAPALGYALSKPYPVAMLVFTMLAIGLALPYLLLSYFPALIKKLPRPGPWMETFKQFMAFPMFATVIWLLWIFSAQTNPGALIMLLVAMLTGALGLWFHGRYSTPVTKVAVKRSAQAVSAILIGSMIWLGAMASREVAEIPHETTVEKYGIKWTVFDTGRIIDLRRQGKTIFLDFTAKW
ncbi:MAG: protein-disulfide reductase DsbD domain-containing protein [Verrucomicrobiales bacterium]